jgi:hypothetical protein
MACPRWSTVCLHTHPAPGHCQHRAGPVHPAHQRSLVTGLHFQLVFLDTHNSYQVTLRVGRWMGSMAFPFLQGQRNESGL